MIREYIYKGDRQTACELKNEGCKAVLNTSGKCIRGKNGNMLVHFKGLPAVVIARLLRKSSEVTIR